MPLSDPARQVLEAAVGSNPDGARQLLAILRTAPAAVRYKPQDRLGPLGMMVSESGAASAPRGLGRPTLPPEHRAAAEAFQQEWLAKGFSKAELADELERCLVRLGEALPSFDGPWQVVGRSPDGPDPLAKIFGS